MKKILKIIAVILACVLTLPITYGVGYLIGVTQNKNNPKTAYVKPEEKLNIMTLNVCSWSFEGKDLETRIDGIAKTIADTAIFYLKNKFKVVDWGYFWLSETPDAPSYGWGSAYIRICTWVILENKYTNSQYVHINTHFDNESSEARRNSIGMILEKAKEFRDLPVVFTGDLNFLEISMGYKDITADCLKDTKALAKDTMNTATFHNADPNAFKDIVLDYILINDKFKALKYEVVKEKYNKRYISDHYAVVACLQVVSGQ